MSAHSSVSEHEAADRLALRERVRRTERLRGHDATTHFNGQSTVAIDGDHATGESYCIAHHVSSADGRRTIMLASIRYLDTFVKRDGSWYFAERNLMVDWTETRPSNP